MRGLYCDGSSGRIEPDTREFLRLIPAELRNPCLHLLTPYGRIKNTVHPAAERTSGRLLFREKELQAMTREEHYMREAIKQAKKAAALKEVPIGCRTERHPQGEQKTGRLASGRLYPLRYAGTMPDVCRRHRSGARQ